MTPGPATLFAHSIDAPYPGLRPYEPSEWPIFFGRERMTDNVIGLLMKQKLLVVHGTSGNGKSSLIRAGVLARLEQEHARFVKSSNRVKNITFPIDLLITILVIPLLVVMLKHSNAQLTMITLVWFYRSFLAEP